MTEVTTRVTLIVRDAPILDVCGSQKWLPSPLRWPCDLAYANLVRIEYGCTSCPTFDAYMHTCQSISEYHCLANCGVIRNLPIRVYPVLRFAEVVIEVVQGKMVSSNLTLSCVTCEARKFQWTRKNLARAFQSQFWFYAVDGFMVVVAFSDTTRRT